MVGPSALPRRIEKGAKTKIADWRVPLPYGMASGDVLLRLEAADAEIIGPVPTATISVAAVSPPKGFPLARIKVINGVPRLFVNGQEIDPTQAFLSRPDELQLRNAVEAGLNLWMVNLEDIGFQENGFEAPGMVYMGMRHKHLCR